MDQFVADGIARVTRALEALLVLSSPAGDFGGAEEAIVHQRLIDPAGDLYLADAAHCFVDEFGFSGGMLSVSDE